MDAEPAIAAVVAGRWDLAAAERAAEREAAERERARELVARWTEARRAGRSADELDALAELTALDPRNASYSPPFLCDARCVALLAEGGRRDEASAAARAAAAKESFRGEPWALAELGRAVRSADPALAAQLAGAAEHGIAHHDEARGTGDSWDRYLAAGQAGWDAQALEVLAEVRAQQGEPGRAAELTRRCIEHDEGSFLDEVRRRRALLARYREAAAKTDP